ncbi:alpha/beta-type small acid-soluble spore protein [uncultured Mailhella sp.]|uniref:alpha/beta-type small acid-soluble spore protein n=1 Tax=uncultured Mailhella sp. TaxID=1981031 RepID=UPI002615CA15|nr:alpha/beta-type small acid-soluble spore protein [uncultured Mailhella sp.]
MAKNSNQLVNPNAREAMNRFKMEAASEVGVSLKQGYNGDLTSRQAGSVGGQMVKNICPIRTVKFRRNDRNAVGHQTQIQYIAALVV